ncbi:exodeoxyribonuclease VII small subunit [Candidatus Persebacteraceae bacterium Df01]|jgi:exodeoxyribonuclease VII small subunit|uniref:Exodeoxyribonuclease 7 small subunit n=1 Tax=Candidatus Doriopsillibacter californiensis TaxID=2970740 RepID=A0ABT7QLE3_9GAMM|nr:exodeoxyribonuclease VII small subunit [Candidatus Persebacteraceae bacterium Df01]
MSPPAPIKKVPKNFEAALHELESMTAALENGDVPLDKVVAACERGAVLISFCRFQLETARGKIQQLEKQSLIDKDNVDG